MNSGPTSGILWKPGEDAAKAESRASPEERAKMLEEERRHFPIPPSPATVWKYYKAPFFEDLLQSGELFLCQVSRFTDKAEARMNDFQLAAMEGMYKDNPEMLVALRAFHESIRQRAWVTCFSLADFEAAHMWKRFCDDSEGVAIRTTFQHLKLALPESGPLASEAYPASVRYEQTPYMPWRIGYLLFQKLTCYSDERELRLCICRPEDQFHADKCMIESIRLPVNLRRLIHRIYVHPAAPDSYFQRVRSLTAKHLPDREKRVRWSTLRK
jgi:hypothetical protein